jgi:hypothetical protein
MMRRPRRMRPTGGPVTVFYFYTVLAVCGTGGAARAAVPDCFPDSSAMPDSTALRLAGAFLEERYKTCDRLPGAVVPSRGAEWCVHPVDKYVFYRSDSVVVLNGGKSMLAAYDRFRTLRRGNWERTVFLHSEFLPYTQLSAPHREPWAIRQIKRLLNLTLGNILRFFAPRFAELWARMSGLWKAAAAAVLALLALLFILLLARALARSRVVQERLSGEPFTAVPAVRTKDWIAEADSRLRAGDGRGALAALYCWFIFWVTERGFVRRQEWWTNRQLVDAVRRSRPAIAGFAQSLVDAYEETEYGHRAVDESAVAVLNSRARAERWGGRR